MGPNKHHGRPRVILSPVEWRYLTRAVYELLLARVRFAATPPGAIIKSFPKPSGSTPESVPSNVIDLALMSWAIAAASARVPWRSDCLIQAMAADRWLRRYGIMGEFYLGAETTQSGAFTAHAWLRCGDVTVTGGAADAYTPLIEPR